MTPTGPSGLERSTDRRSTPVEDEEDEVQEVEVLPGHNDSQELKEALDKLRSLCIVLGVNYTAKISEFGTLVEKTRLDEAIEFLITTRDRNFEELRKISNEMITEWRLSRPPFKRMTEFAWILYIRDAVDADELSFKDLLSTDSVHTARKEVMSLKKERDEAVERRYTAKRIKLRDLLKYTHLYNKDINFTAKEQVEKSELKSEIQNVKQVIRRVKSLASLRTNLVLRVELVRKAKSLEDLEVLISNAKSAARVLKTDGEAVPYDGRDVDDILNLYREQVIAAALKKEEKKVEKKKSSSKGVASKGTKKALPGRTRKGTVYKRREDADDEETSEGAGEDAADGAGEQPAGASARD